MADNTLVAVDLAKTVFQVAVSNHPGQVSKNRRLSRTQLAEFLAQLPEATIREFGILIPVGAQHAVPNAWLHIEDAATSA